MNHSYDVACFRIIEGGMKHLWSGTWDAISPIHAWKSATGLDLSSIPDWKATARGANLRCDDIRWEVTRHD